MNTKSNKKRIVWILFLFVIVITIFVLSNRIPIAIVKGKFYSIIDTELHFSGSDGEFTEKDEVALSRLWWAESIYMLDTKINNIDFLSEMPNLNHLNICEYHIEDWSALEQCPNLESIHAVNIDVSDLSPFKSLENLKYLNISFDSDILECSKLTDISDVKYLTELETLWLCGNDISDISALESCVKLQELTLQGITADDYSVLLKLPNLRFLVMDTSLVNEEILNSLIEREVEIYGFD